MGSIGFALLVVTAIYFGAVYYRKKFLNFFFDQISGIKEKEGGGKRSRRVGQNALYRAGQMAGLLRDFSIVRGMSKWSKSAAHQGAAGMPGPDAHASPNEGSPAGVLDGEVIFPSDWNRGSIGGVEGPVIDIYPYEYQYVSAGLLDSGGGPGGAAGSPQPGPGGPEPGGGAGNPWPGPDGQALPPGGGFPALGPGLSGQSPSSGEGSPAGAPDAPETPEDPGWGAVAGPYPPGERGGYGGLPAGDGTGGLSAAASAPAGKSLPPNAGPLAGVPGHTQLPGEGAPAGGPDAEAAFLGGPSGGNDGESAIPGGKDSFPAEPAAAPAGQAVPSDTEIPGGAANASGRFGHPAESSPAATPDTVKAARPRPVAAVTAGAPKPVRDPAGAGADAAMREKDAETLPQLNERGAENAKHR